MKSRVARAARAAAGILMLVACSGPRSALDPAGRGAERIAELFWWMAAGAVIISVAFIGLAAYAIFLAPERHTKKRARLLIVVGGVVFPTIVLTGLLVYGLAFLPRLLAAAPEGSLKIAVTGHQWWWRFRYLPPSGDGVDLANEIRLPVGKPVEFQLESADVIHSFWIPALGGKVDMIPGHRTRLVLEPTRTGVFRGTCAEYCGTSHALMRFSVIVLPQDEFDRWLAEQASPAAPSTTPLGKQGEELFIANGCGACHAVRGTVAAGVVGPDLTHVGSRLGIGADVLASTENHFLDWLSRTDQLKPEVHMPAFGMLPEEQLRALAVYLKELK